MRQKHFNFATKWAILWYSVLNKVGFTKRTSTFYLVLWYADNDFIIICNNKSEIAIKLSIPWKAEEIQCKLHVHEFRLKECDQ